MFSLNYFLEAVLGGFDGQVVVEGENGQIGAPDSTAPATEQRPPDVGPTDGYVVFHL